MTGMSSLEWLRYMHEQLGLDLPPAVVVEILDELRPRLVEGLIRP